MEVLGQKIIEKGRKGVADFKDVKGSNFGTQNKEEISSLHGKAKNKTGMCFKEKFRQGFANLCGKEFLGQV